MPIIGKCPAPAKGMALQTVLLWKGYATKSEFFAWLRRHGLRAVIDSSSSENVHHARQADPDCFIPKSFRSKAFRDGNLILVFGKLKR
jgi:hypothetical protein